MNSSQRDQQNQTKLLYPPEDIPLLAWFEGVHDAVFVAFHPFFRLAGAVVEPWEVRSVPKGELVSRVPGYPNDPETLANAQRLCWVDIAAGAGLHGVRAVNYALLTWIRALKADLEDRQGEQALRSFLRSSQIWPPTEGYFQKLMWPMFLAACDLANEPALVAIDEFGDKRVEVPRSQLTERTMDPLLDPIGERGSIFPSSMKFLITVHWDSFFTLICGSRPFVERLVSQAEVDGFFCDNDTKHTWSMPVH